MKIDCLVGYNFIYIITYNNIINNTKVLNKNNPKGLNKNNSFEQCILFYNDVL